MAKSINCLSPKYMSYVNEKIKSQSWKSSPVLKSLRHGNHWGLFGTQLRKIVVLLVPQWKINWRVIEEDIQCRLVASILPETYMYICTHR